MLRAKSLGSLTFNNPNTLFIQEQYSNENVQGLKRISASGTAILYKATLHTPTITLDSKQWSLLTEEQCDTLNAMWDDIGTEIHTLTYSDNSTEDVTFDYSRDLVFTELWEGACEFRALIPLIKVI